MDVIELVDRYFEAWNEPDEEKRGVLGRELWTDDGRYVDPLSDTLGPDAFSAMIGAIREQSGAIVVRRSSPVESHHDVARFHWEICGPDGTVAAAGIDVATVRDGRLCQMTGFMGEQPAA